MNEMKLASRQLIYEIKSLFINNNTIYVKGRANASMLTSVADPEGGKHIVNLSFVCVCFMLDFNN